VYITDAYIEKLSIPFDKCGEFCVEEYLEEWFAKEARQDYGVGRGLHERFAVKSGL
jgi:hypothetical protein